MPKKTNGRAARQYPCFGEMLTVKEAADRVFVSVATMRNRLQKCGDNMEVAMRYYQDQDARRERSTDAVVDELVTAIMGGEPEEETPTGAIEGGDELEQVSVEQAFEEIESADPERAEKLASLRRYNGAIAGLTGLMDVDCESGEMCDMLVKCLGVLRSARRCKFDHLVDWDAIAAGRCNMR